MAAYLYTLGNPRVAAERVGGAELWQPGEGAPAPAPTLPR